MNSFWVLVVLSAASGSTAEAEFKYQLRCPDVKPIVTDNSVAGLWYNVAHNPEQNYDCDTLTTSYYEDATDCGYNLIRVIQDYEGSQSSTDDTVIVTCSPDGAYRHVEDNGEYYSIYAVLAAKGDDYYIAYRCSQYRNLVTEENVWIYSRDGEYSDDAKKAYKQVKADNRLNFELAFKTDSCTLY